MKKCELLIDWGKIDFRLNSRKILVTINPDYTPLVRFSFWTARLFLYTRVVGIVVISLRLVFNNLFSINKFAMLC